VAMLVMRLLTTAILWVQIQTSVKNTKWATKANKVANTAKKSKLLKVLKVIQPM
jgi:hypothetical protein